MRVRLFSAALVVALVASLVAVAGYAQAQTPAPLRVISFDGGWNLPVWAAQRQGFFETNGVSVQLTYTPNSAFLVTSLLDGKLDIALATIDNLIAYQEGQGEAKIADNPDLFAFMGGDGGFLSIAARPGIKDVAGLKGGTLSVDAMTTGLAFVLRELVVRGGLAETDVTFVRAGGTANRYRDLIAGKHDATLLRTPFELLARERGFVVLASAESLGAYQGTAGFARRSWARDHEAALVGFLRAYKAATDWLYDRKNRDVVEALLIANIRDMTPALARQSYDLLLAEKGGLARDLAPDAAGIRTVLELRTKYGVPQKSLADPMKYVDLGYYEKAFGKR
ncbi:MAG TPA: ABC transporter substrate-binding protein [Casimicrobiaceae bacterium]|nr:ABC transporter substrate-binding protein [Casimicrobiaceae bacterium]